MQSVFDLPIIDIGIRIIVFLVVGKFLIGIIRKGIEDFSTDGFSGIWQEILIGALYVGVIVLITTIGIGGTFNLIVDIFKKILPYLDGIKNWILGG